MKEERLKHQRIQKVAFSWKNADFLHLGAFSCSTISELCEVKILSIGSFVIKFKNNQVILKLKVLCIIILSVYLLIKLVDGVTRVHQRRSSITIDFYLNNENLIRLAFVVFLTQRICVILYFESLNYRLFQYLHDLAGLNLSSAKHPRVLLFLNMHLSCDQMLSQVL